jgi:uncharacterized surface protein with fasciclin (FAS1) repeats
MNNRHTGHKIEEVAIMKTAITIVTLTLLAGLAAVQAQEVSQSRDLLSLADSNREIGMFVGAARSSGMAKMLRDEGPFTLFAVRNQAFANLPKEDREILMTNPGAMHFLLAHYVVRGNVNVEDRAGLESARTLDGMRLRVDVRSEGVYVNGSRLGLDTIHSANGTIYVLDHFDPGWVHDALSLARPKVASK